MLRQKRNLKIGLVVGLAVFPGCFGTGIDGGGGQLTAKFAGVDSVTVLSPASVTVRWTPLSNYKNYRVYISSQETPIETSLFNSKTIEGLQPGTNYSFSVAGIKEDGTQDGASKQMTAQTWAPFYGPTSATAIDSANVQVAWNYEAGPSFKIFANANTPLTPDQLKGTPALVSQSSTGATVSGLRSNTTYYFSVIATYPDGTTNMDSFNLNAATATANYTESYLVSLPTVTTAAIVKATDYPTFTVANAPASYQTSIYKESVAPANLLATINANGTVNASSQLPTGVHNFIIKIVDVLSNYTAYGVFSGIVSAADPAANFPTVSATTPTSLFPLPKVTAPSIQLGPYPTFTVTGSLLGYKTEIFHNGTAIGSILGNGSLTTLSSKPLPQGLVTVVPKVSSNGQYAYLPPITIRIKTIDTMPYVGPTSLNGGGAGAAGIGTDAVVGDFNCDGYDDVAMGGQSAPFTKPAGYSVQYNYGGVVVYYGTATGLNLSASPSLAPQGTQPLLIPAPSTSLNVATYGIRFGATVAKGNINGDTVSGRACEDLIVGAQSDYAEGFGRNRGAIYVYYGAPTGLQVTDYLFNSIACLQSSSYNCFTGKHGPATAADVFVGDYTYEGGLGTSVAAGDFNGDGFDDVASGFIYHTDTDTTNTAGTRQKDGAVFLFWGTANGLSPSYVMIQMPKNTATTHYSQMGRALAFGYVSDSTHTKKDLLITIPALKTASGLSGFLWVKGTDNIAANLDSYGHLTAGYALVQPPQCTMERCGYSITATDFNQDGYEDIALGSPRVTIGGFDSTGAVHIYYGSNAGPYNPATAPAVNQVTCSNPNDFIGCNPQIIYRADSSPWWSFGTAVSNLGDTNGDGYPDLGIGAQRAAPAKNGRYTNNGVAYVLYGSAYGLSPSPSTYINANSPPNGLFGTQIVGGKFRADFGGSSFKDILVTAPGESDRPENYSQGIGHIYYNNGSGFPVSLTTESARTEATPAVIAGEYFFNARIAGDLNGDGFADVVAPVNIPGPLGSLNNLAQTTGAPSWGAVIYYGSANGLITSPSPQFNPVGMTDPLLIVDTGFNDTTFYSPSMGNMILPAGDVNGDGFKDIALLGAQTAYLFYGSASGLMGRGSGPAPRTVPATALDPKIISHGASVGTYGGCGYPSPQLSTSGDFNGDGYSDIALASNHAGIGALFIIYGSFDGLIAGGYIKDPSRADYPDANPANNTSLTPACSGFWPNAICTPLQICANNVGICAGRPALPFSPSFGGRGIFSRIQSAGDLDRDGTDDLVLVDAGDSYFTGSADGALYILYGDSATGIDPTRYVRLRISPQYVPIPAGGSARALGQYGVCTTFNEGSLSNAEDVNGDGIADLVVGARAETTGPAPTSTTPSPTRYNNGGAAYLIYGINGGYRALGPSVCASYPCDVVVSNATENVPNFSPVTVVDNVNNSCDTSTNECNVLRFHPYDTTYNVWGFGGGVAGMGDITGDGFGDIAVATFNRGPAAIYVYSGGQSGLQVASKASGSPICTEGQCTPFMFIPPSSDLSYAGAGFMQYLVNGWHQSGDIDGDGKNDFPISSYYFSNPDGKGHWVGGFFLFH